MDKPNLVGKRFGRLLVTASTISKHNRSRWMCQCDCGNSCVKTGKYMRSGKSLSCGCIKREQNVELARTMSVNNTLLDGQSSCNSLHATYKWQAKKRGFQFDLSREDFHQLTSSPCHYCGALPINIVHAASCKTPYTYNGVDRMDNRAGYTRNNSVPCCTNCNMAKRALTVEQFIQHCREVVTHQNSKKSAEMPDSLFGG